MLFVVVTRLLISFVYICSVFSFSKRPEILCLAKSPNSSRKAFQSEAVKVAVEMISLKSEFIKFYEIIETATRALFDQES